jgi:hypothetical protein
MSTVWLRVSSDTIPDRTQPTVGVDAYLMTVHLAIYESSTDMVALLVLCVSREVRERRGDDGCDVTVASVPPSARSCERYKIKQDMKAMRGLQDSQERMKCCR